MIISTASVHDKCIFYHFDESFAGVYDYGYRADLMRYQAIAEGEESIEFPDDWAAQGSPDTVNAVGPSDTVDTVGAVDTTDTTKDQSTLDKITDTIETTEGELENSVFATSTINPMHDGAYLVGADGHRTALVNYRNATDPTYDQLINFILIDDTDRRIYDPNSFVCSDFAETVHNNAEKAGIKAGWVDIDFTGEGDSTDHACNVFNTIDQGLVFIDCTGGEAGERIGSHDKIVYVAEGAEYKMQPIGNNRDGLYYYPMGTVASYVIIW